MTAAAAACTCASAIARSSGSGLLLPHRIRLGLRHIGACAGNVAFGLVKRLLGLEALTCQRAGSC